MAMTDPISDMLARIRNAHHARHEKVEIPASKIKLELARVFKAEGYIKNYKLIQDKRQGTLRVFLRYNTDGEPVIREIKRVSKPGRRIYTGADQIPLVRNGLGVSIVSTSKGIMTDKEARKIQVGGEVICSIW